MAETSPSPQQIEFLRKTAGGLLVEFVASTARELLRHSDQFQVHEIFSKMIREMSINSPLFQIENIANKKGIEAVVSVMLVHSSAMCGPDNVQGEIREKGAVQTYHNCIFKDSVPEICFFMSHVSTNVLCQLAVDHFAAPELESLWTHNLPAGDPFCRVVLKKKTTPYKDPDSLGNVIMKMPRVNLTDEWFDQYRKFIVASFWINITICFKMLHGSEKTVEILGANAKRIGKNFGSSLIEANMLPVRDISVMGSLLNKFQEMIGVQGRITSMAPGIFAKEITECPFRSGPLEVGQPEICRQWEAFFNGILEVTNPELEYRYDRMMTTGEKTCKWVIKKK